jgi:hypothetical protein
MQVARPSAAAAGASGAAAATDHLVARLDPQIARDVPRAVLDAPLGDGTVASEIERAVRIRFDGEGEPSTREVVPETKAAVDLLASPAGDSFERAMHAIASVADGHRGADDLKTITLHPDEQTTLAGEVLDDVDLRLRDGERLDRLDRPGRAKAFVDDAIDGELADLAFRSAVNTNGHISVAPDVSREFLASLGMYQPGRGDEVLAGGTADREDTLLESWKTLVHETHHSVTPEYSYDDEAINVFEEAIPTVLERLQGAPIAAKAGADLAGVAAHIGDGGAVDARAGALGWKPWNRDRLPAPSKALEETAEGRYTDGPALVEDLLELAGVDRNAPDGIAKVDALLQGERAAAAPRRLAEAIADAHGMSVDHTRELERLIRDAAVGDATFDDIRDFVGS